MSAKDRVRPLSSSVAASRASESSSRSRRVRRGRRPTWFASPPERATSRTHIFCRDGDVNSLDALLDLHGSNLDANKARMLLMASMLKLGRLPKAEDPRHPTSAERRVLAEKVAAYQQLFDDH